MYPNANNNQFIYPYLQQQQQHLQQQQLQQQQQQQQQAQGWMPRTNQIPLAMNQALIRTTMPYQATPNPAQINVHSLPFNVQHYQNMAHYTQPNVQQNFVPAMQTQTVANIQQPALMNEYLGMGTLYSYIQICKYFAVEYSSKNRGCCC